MLAPHLQFTLSGKRVGVSSLGTSVTGDVRRTPAQLLSKREETLNAAWTTFPEATQKQCATCLIYIKTTSHTNNVRKWSSPYPGLWVSAPRDTRDEGQGQAKGAGD